MAKKEFWSNSPYESAFHNGLSDDTKQTPNWKSIFLGVAGGWILIDIIKKLSQSNRGK